MRITEYIKNKDDIRLYNLSGDQKILDELELNNIPVKSTFLKIDNQHLSNNYLVIIIINSKMILDDLMFKNIIGLNNILMLIIYDNSFIEHEIECKDIMISHGYKYFGNTANDNAVIFIYDISIYKEKPDWLNSDNWADPELWEK